MTPQDYVESKILRFASVLEAQAWLDETEHYGRIHADTRGGFMIVRFDEGQTWAFASPTQLVLIVDW